MPRLFEQVENTNPSLLQRIGFGRLGNITENMTLTNFLIWLNANLTYPVVPTLLNQAVIDIGDWDMNVSAAGSSSVSIAHGLDLTKIRRVTVMVRDDAGTFQRPIDSISLIGTIQDGGITALSSTNVDLNIKTGGNFDNANHDALAYNRGWITIEYTN